MANKTEAKILFTAETGGFNDEIKKSNAEMSKLRSEMKLNAEQMKQTGVSVEGLQEKQRILAKEMDAARAKTEALSGKIEAAKRLFGENSEEVKKLEKQLIEAKTAEVKLQGEIDRCNAELDQQQAEAKKTTAAFDDLQKTIEDQQGELDVLKKKYADVVVEQGKESDEAERLAREIQKLSQELKKNKDKMDDAEKSADELDKSLEKTGETTVDASGKFDLATVAVAALGAAFIAVGKASIDAFNEVDEGADNVIKATGATGKAAEELTDVYTEVAKNVVGSLDEIGATVGEVNTRFGYTGTELEECSTAFMQFAEITGVNSTDAVKAVTRALNDAGIPLEEYDSLLDQLAKAGQMAGIDVMTLADSLSKNGSVMRSMGFDTSETISLLSQFELAGADTSTMLGGMKKAMAVWADSGKDGRKEFGKLVEGIKKGSVKASDAIDVFGTKAGPMLVDAIKSGKFEYNDMLKVIKKSKGTLQKTFDELEDGGYKVELSMQNLKVMAGELGEEIMENAGPAFEGFIDELERTGAVKKMGDGIGNLSKTVLPAFAKIVNFAADNFDKLVTGIGTAVVVYKTFSAAMAVTTAIRSATTAVSALSTGVGIATKVQVGWNAAMAANPIGAVVTAVGLLVGGLVLLSSTQRDAIEPLNVLTEEERKLTEAADDTAQAFREQKAATDETIGGIMAEMGQVQSLADELETLVDAKGRVKKSDEARVQFILNELNEALGTEYSMTNGIVQKYADLKKNIDAVIQSKTANALLEASNADYVAAIQAEGDALHNVKLKEEELLAQKAYTIGKEAEYVQQKENLELRRQGALEAGNMYEYGILTTRIGYLDAEMQKVRDTEAEKQKAYDDALADYGNYHNTIMNYEEAQTAALEGNYNRTVDILKNKGGSFNNYAAEVDDATRDTIDSLYKEAVDAGIEADRTRTNFEKGVKGYTAKMVEEAENGYSEALLKWATAYDSAHAVGTDLGGGLKAGMENTRFGLIQKARQMVSSIIAAFRKEADSHSPSRKMIAFGEDMGEGGEIGLESKTGDMVKVAKSQVKDLFKVYEGAGDLVSPLGSLTGVNGGGRYNPQQSVQSNASAVAERTMLNGGWYAYVQAVEKLASRAIELNVNGQRFATATAADTDKVNGERMTFAKMGLAIR